MCKPQTGREKEIAWHFNSQLNCLKNKRVFLLRNYTFPLRRTILTCVQNHLWNLITFESFNRYWVSSGCAFYPASFARYYRTINRELESDSSFQVCRSRSFSPYLWGVHKNGKDSHRQTNRVVHWLKYFTCQTNTRSVLLSCWNCDNLLSCQAVCAIIISIDKLASRRHTTVSSGICFVCHINK